MKKNQNMKKYQTKGIVIEDNFKTCQFLSLNSCPDLEKKLFFPYKNGIED